MAYQGWNREELLAAGNAMKANSHVTIPYFTPINHNRTFLPTSNLLDVAGNGFDNNSLHELRDDPIPDSSAESSKKRNPLPSKGRAVSLKRVWEYKDEEDIYSNWVASEEPLPKRKKTMISKRSQSLKIPSTNSAKWGLDGGGGICKERASQLTTPLDSSKRKSSKAEARALNSKGKEMLPFKNLTITKPSNAQNKETAWGGPRSNSIISHQGWRSTEDNVKSTSVVLAKTTMERLAAFRLQSDPDPQAMRDSQPYPKMVHSEMAVADFPHEPLQGTTYPSSNHDLTSDDSFNKAIWSINAYTKFSGIDEAQTESTVIANKVPNNTLLRQQPNAKTGKIDSAGDNSSRMSTDTRSRSAGYLMGVPACAVESSQSRPGENADYVDPTSSEARAFADLSVGKTEIGRDSRCIFNCTVPASNDAMACQSQPEAIGIIASRDPSIVEGPRSRIDEPLPTHDLDQALNVESHKLPQRSNHHVERSEILDDEARYIFPVEYDARFISHEHDPDELPKRNKQLSIYRVFGGCNTDIQVGRSDMDESEMTPKETSRDLWLSDEFDQGLDDEDLLAIVSDTVIPQTPTKAQLDQQEGPRAYGRFILPSALVTEEPNVRGSLTPQNIAHRNSSPPPVPDVDDEFPMDEGDEEEMLKLLGIEVGIKESSAPPESVQRAFNKLVDGEVYDNSLQFSSPTSQISAASLSKMAQDHQTDQNRTCQSPGIGGSVAVEEEDWSFIHSEGDENLVVESLSDHLCHPNSIARFAKPRQAVSPFPPSRTVANHDGVQTPGTQMTTDISWSIIDDSHEYKPMDPFARPHFPCLVLDRSPVVGLSAQSYLRTCFRIGEMFNEGVRCSSLGQDMVIELFARVTFSSREAGSTKQHFQFADLWHDRPPYPNGLLANYKTAALAESESKVFLGEKGKMARCLGRFKRDLRNSVLILHLINIRETDWEEIRWTKEIVSHERVKTQ